MNILILRHSAEQVILNGKRHVLEASELEHSTGYALNKKQNTQIKIGDPIYIIDKDNELAFKGTIKKKSPRKVKLNVKTETRQDFQIENLEPHIFVNVPFVKGWETHRGVKVMPVSVFSELFV